MSDITLVKASQHLFLLKTLAHSNSFSSFKIDSISSQNHLKQFHPKQALITFYLIINAAINNHQRNTPRVHMTIPQAPKTQNNKILALSGEPSARGSQLKRWLNVTGRLALQLQRQRCGRSLNACLALGFPSKSHPKSLILIPNIPKVIKNIFEGPNTSFNLFQHFENINLYINYHGFSLNSS